MEPLPRLIAIAALLSVVVINDQTNAGVVNRVTGRREPESWVKMVCERYPNLVSYCAAHGVRQQQTDLQRNTIRQRAPQILRHRQQAARQTVHRATPVQARSRNEQPQQQPQRQTQSSVIDAPPRNQSPQTISFSPNTPVINMDELPQYCRKFSLHFDRFCFNVTVQPVHLQSELNQYCPMYHKYCRERDPNVLETQPGSDLPPGLRRHVPPLTTTAAPTTTTLQSCTFDCEEAHCTKQCICEHYKHVIIQNCGADALQSDRCELWREHCEPYIDIFKSNPRMAPVPDANEYDHAAQYYYYDDEEEPGVDQQRRSSDEYYSDDFGHEPNPNSDLHPRNPVLQAVWDHFGVPPASAEDAGRSLWPDHAAPPAHDFDETSDFPQQRQPGAIFGPVRYRIRRL